MSDTPQLPGYSVDDDTHEDNDDAHHIDVLTAEPEHASDLVLSAGVGDADAVPFTTTATSPTRQDSTQSRSTPPNRQDAGVEHPTATITATPTTPPLPVDEFADPKISGLHAIFPDYDAAILHSIVDSVGGDQDRAIDALLAMSDPDHVPAPHAAANEPPSQAEQTQLDEEFARQLLLEDEQQYARDQIALRQQQQQEQMRQFPYAQRTSSIHRGDTAQQQQQQQQQSPPQRDTMSDMQEQFSKLAETGKRTFTSLVSKVKAKVQDFDQQRNTPNAASSGTGASIGTGYAVEPAAPGVDRHAQQAYYAPRVSPNPQPGPINDDFENPLLVSSSTVDRGSSASTPPPPVTNNGRPVTNIDPGKIGLLPKRPVSLVNTESQSSHAHDEDEEELEYLENPFEEGKYS